MKKSLLFTTILIALTSKAQQDIQFSGASMNLYGTNCAAIGLDGLGEAQAYTRSQWTAIEDAPQTHFFGISNVFGKNKKEYKPNQKHFYQTPDRVIGKRTLWGLQAYNDKIGPFTRNRIQATLTSHLQLTKKVNMGLGFGIGSSSFGIDESKVSLNQTGDLAYQTYLSSSASQRFLDAQIGFVLYSPKFYFGLSSSQFFGNKTKLGGYETESRFARHLYINTSYFIYQNDQLSVEPYAMIKHSKNTPWNLELGTRVYLNKYGFASIGCRVNSALSVGLGINIFSHFTLVYAREIAISNTRSFGTGANEIGLKYRFGGKPKVKKEKAVNEEVPIEIIEE